MGGFIGAEVAIRFPRRVERLVLVSAAGIATANLRRAPALTVGRMASVVTAYTAARHEQMTRRPISRHMALAFVARHPSRLAPDLAWEALIKGAGKPGFQSALRACLDYDFRDRLPEIACPSLVVWGENDAVLPAADAHEFERLIADARKVMMSDTGHVPMLERPEAFNDVLMGFLAETGPAEAREPVPGASEVA
jgi:pimeloyl-ACP methyl ester carboxylesterase